MVRLRDIQGFHLRLAPQEGHRVRVTHRDAQEPETSDLYLGVERGAPMSIREDPSLSRMTFLTPAPVATVMASPSTIPRSFA